MKWELTNEVRTQNFNESIDFNRINSDSEVHGVQEVAGSNPVFPTFHKPLPNRDLRYLTTFVSAVKTLFQSW